MKLDAQDILMRWAGVDGVAADPDGRRMRSTRRSSPSSEKYFGYELTPRDGKRTSVRS